ncbi:MAG: esterase-like activity of phytase family protein [Paracoccaceae bacterium]
MLLGLSLTPYLDRGAGASPRSLIQWREDSADFGGLSGLTLTGSDGSFAAVSDRGYFALGHFIRDTDGVMTGVTLDAYVHMLDNKGGPVDRFHGDAEAVRLMPDGRVAVAYESYTRIALFRLPDPHPEVAHRWDQFMGYLGNHAFEALAVDQSGKLLAMLEWSVGKDYQTFVRGPDNEWQKGPPLPTDDRFAVTDAAFGPDGRLFLLERRFSIFLGYQTRLTSYDPTEAGFVMDKIELLTRMGQFGDMEGLDVWQDEKGRLIATMISDDNFLGFRPTTVAEFVLKE